jgi:hypothetical protein
MKRKNTILKFARSKFQRLRSIAKAETIFVDPPISNPPMNEQTVVPPPHVWSKIERILDEQEKTKAILAASKPVVNGTICLTSENTPFIFAPLGRTFLA